MVNIYISVCIQLQVVTELTLFSFTKVLSEVGGASVKTPPSLTLIKPTSFKQP